MICEKCEKEFEKDWRKDKESIKTPCRFCSRKCSNSKKHTKETKSKIAESLRLVYNSKYCKLCNKKLNHKNKSGVCLNCKAPAKTRYESIKIFRKKRKNFLLDVKGSKCQICSYSFCKEALEFHHLDPTKKEFTISNTKATRTLEEDLKEIEKCILVCNRCHREIHYGLIKINNQLS